MKEKMSDKNILKKNSIFVESILIEKLRSLQEVMGDFHHLKNCSRSQSLKKVTKDFVLYTHDEGKLSVVTRKDYIECSECRVSQRYREN